MIENSDKNNKDIAERNRRNSQLFRYSAITAQIFVSIGLGLFIGMKADGWLHLSFPLLVWLLPLLIIFGIIYKIIKDTSGKNERNF
ncbi:MAG: AtpZ/AtpI family protein [Bacteroidota bacterium]|nr:AtpZ/AtpI family protein [Bacteroidota bacterium]